MLSTSHAGRGHGAVALSSAGASSLLLPRTPAAEAMAQRPRAPPRRARADLGGSSSAPDASLLPPPSMAAADPGAEAAVGREGLKPPYRCNLHEAPPKPLLQI